jgi:hypothetical protein
MEKEKVMRARTPQVKEKEMRAPKVKEKEQRARTPKVKVTKEVDNGVSEPCNVCEY